MLRTLRTYALRAGMLLLVVGCAEGFKVGRFRTNESLFQAGMRELNRKKWDNAIAAFEKLTLELPARDPLLPRAHLYLARAHSGKREHLLAAQSYIRLSETFPDDTLSDDALLLAGREYRKMWRKPELDAQYGHTAAATFRSLAELYPDSPLAAEATREIARLQEWFATKDFESGMFYMRRKAYDSAILYFLDVTQDYPTTARAREAYLRLLEAYRKINYRDDIREICEKIRSMYPGDREVAAACGTTPEKSVAPPMP